jgi:hypothetical protein
MSQCIGARHARDNARQEHNLGLSRKHFRFITAWRKYNSSKITAYELVVAKHFIPQLLGMVTHGQIA